jgi:hypothetical protein
MPVLLQDDTTLHVRFNADTPAKQGAQRDVTAESLNRMRVTNLDSHIMTQLLLQSSATQPLTAVNPASQ